MIRPDTARAEAISAGGGTGGLRSPAAPTRVWIGGRVLAESEGRVSIADRGFLFGDGLFETVRTRQRKAFRLDLHLERLRTGAEIVGIRPTDGIESAVHQLLGAGAPGAGALRITLTRGVGAAGLRDTAGADPVLVISLRPAPPFQVARPLSVGISAVPVLAGSPLSGLKTLGYLPNVVALRRAAGDDDLMLDERGRLAQGTSSNLFWVTAAGELRTPSSRCGVRAGVTRQTVLELAACLGIPVREGEWPSDEIAGAREVFLTSSLRGLAPVGVVAGRPVGDGAPGGSTRLLQDAYRTRFLRETD